MARSGRKRGPWRRLRKKILRWLAVHVLGGPLLRLWSATWRMRFENAHVFERLQAEGEHLIFCFWHNRMLPFVRSQRNSGICVMISQHGDGEIIARIVENHGFRTARGSSTRGGAAALKGLADALRTGDVALTPDGPRGPRYAFKRGAVQLASRAGRPIVLASAAPDRAWTARSWDRFLLPKPFARIHMRVLDTPLRVPPDLDDEGLNRWSREAERQLRRLTADLDRDMGREVDPILVNESASPLGSGRDRHHLPQVDST
jgi:lysophospholipid acyltransferase (LPLAT)-like uncharacterized protein